MKRWVIAMISILLTVFLGCTTLGMIMEKNNANLMKLEMGMSKQEVIKIMGTPTFNEAYQSLQGRSVVILFYYT